MADDSATMPDDEWQQDREVFSREAAEDGETGELYVSPAARKRWSDKNPRKFTPEVALLVIQYVGAGSFLETAAAAAGISKVTLHSWLRQAERLNDSDDGKAGTEELRAWKEQINQAEANAEARASNGILVAGADSWQAYAWYLERRYPQRWGRKDTVAHVGPDGGPLQTADVSKRDPSSMNSEQVGKEIRELMAKARGAQQVQEPSPGTEPKAP